MTAMAAAIVKTVVHFDLLSYPLDALEVHRWLYRFSASPGEVARALFEDPDVLSRLSSKDGFWFLRGREQLVVERLRRARIAERKLARARRVAMWLARIPGVRLVMLANTLALAASRDEGDIDLAIITDPGRIWTVRAIAAGALDVFGLRPKGGKRDAVCLSFFATTEFLNLGALRLSGADDIHFAYWVATLRPLEDPNGMYAKLWASHAWLRDILPNAWPRCHGAYHGTGTFRGSLSLIESRARRIQETRFPPAIRNLANRDTRVVVSNDVLKFHTNDRREEYRKRWTDAEL